MAELKVLDKNGVEIPTELKQLPIFRFLGDKIPAQMKTPEAKKTFGAALFWALVIGGSLFFFKNLGTLIEYGERTLIFLLYAIAIVALIIFSGPIISILHRLSRIFNLKGHRKSVQANPIESLMITAQDVQSTLKEVDKKITAVDASGDDMITQAEKSKEAAEKALRAANNLNDQVKELQSKAADFEKNGNKEKANALRRDAKEAGNNSFLRVTEAENFQKDARVYAQYANQIKKLVEVLKDNRSAARIFLSSLNSSISILEKKMELTTRAKSATDGLAEAFNIKDTWVFTEAISAATSAINSNVAGIRSNLQMMDANNNIFAGGVTPSTAELETMIQKLNAQEFQKFNISEIADPSYDLTSKERVDPGFRLLD